MFKALLAVVAATSLLASPAIASDRASKAEAEAMVKKAVAHVKSKGESAYADFTAPSKSFVDRDLYIVVYGLDGKCLAHGQNAKQVGKDLLNLKDPDGKLFVKERVELAQSKGAFWQDYKFTDPLTKAIMPKQMYCEKVDKVAVCGGVYK
ncbi:MAG: histidine kinase [Betaproteobacteria bacterium]|jgi:signal transduction histidine kinase|nr:histidine kinase [Betaproteobacteria bacterium]